MIILDALPVNPGRNRAPRALPPEYLHRLRPAEIEKEFLSVVLDLKVIIVLDGIDEYDNPPKFRIRSHDFYGPLPDILIDDTGNRAQVKVSIAREAAKLVTIVRERDNLAFIFPGSGFLLPTKTDKGVLVGLRFAVRTVLAEDTAYWTAYQELARKAILRLL